ncbi:MAG: hypothetical protein K2L82_08465 [Lachnospiraceae bacterium]|nr:hypothetical protein [Lachnospiraceae bacterium]
MYFSLLNHCILVFGAEKGVIYNLKERKAIELEKEECGLVAYAEKGNALSDGMEKSDTLLRLAKIGWGFFSERRYFIDKIRPYNHFTLTRPDLAPENPQIAYLQLNHRCRLGAKECGKRFCTPCRCTDVGTDVLALEQWIDIAERLYHAGVREFILTGGDVLEYEGLPRLCDYMQRLGVMPVLIVNHADERLRVIDKDIPLIIYLCADKQSADEIKAATGEFEHVTVLSDSGFPSGSALLTGGKIRSVQVKNMAVIDKNDFLIPGVAEFYQRKDRDLCLLGKVFVKSNADVVPCFQMGGNKVGNLLDDSVRAIIHSLSEKYWKGNTPKDAGCISCEWFYACPVCKGMSAEKVCPL